MTGMPILRKESMAQRRNYKFTNKKHTEKAVMSTVFGSISVLSLVTVIYLTYTRAGDAPVNYGISGILILLFAVIGLILGIIALRETDKFKFFGRLGCILSGLALLGISGILYVGAYF